MSGSPLEVEISDCRLNMRTIAAGIEVEAGDFGVANRLCVGRWVDARISWIREVRIGAIARLSRDRAAILSSLISCRPYAIVVVVCLVRRKCCARTDSTLELAYRPSSR